MDRLQFDSGGWPEIVSLLGGEAALAASARDHKALLRKRQVKSASDLLRLAFIYGPGGHSLRTTAGLSQVLGIADLSDVALMKRMSASGGWLEALCSQRLSPIARPAGTQAAGLQLRIRDATSIVGPDKTRYVLHACYDPQESRMCDLALTPSACGEGLDRLAVHKGDLLIADRGYPRPEAFAKTLAAGAGLLVRITWKSLRLADGEGVLVDWAALFAKAQSGGIDMPVLVTRARGKFTPQAMRLVILPKPPQAATAARTRASRDNRTGQSKTIDPRTLAAADHLILITSLKARDVAADRLRELYGVRWQIELAFKRMKSILDLASLPAKYPGLARAWLYAHLLAALIIDDIRFHTDVFSPQRYNRSGQTKASFRLAPHTSHRLSDQSHHAAAYITGPPNDHDPKTRPQNP